MNVQFLQIIHRASTPLCFLTPPPSPFPFETILDPHVHIEYMQRLPDNDHKSIDICLINR